MSIVISPPRLVTILSLVVGSLVLAPFTTVLHASENYTGCGGAVVSAQNATYEAEVVFLVNEERATAGLPPMKLIPELTTAARYHAADMAADNYFSHPSQDRVDGALTQVCTWSDRIASFYTGYWTLAENIAWGYSTPADVVEGWMNSPGHRANILGNYTEIGVGYIDSRWVQDFGDRKSSAPLIINREALQVFTPQVTLYLHGSGSEMRLRNDDQPWGEWQPFQAEFSWTLQPINGERRVDVEVRRGTSTVSGSDTIVLSGATAATSTPTPTTAAPTATPRPPTATPVILPSDLDETVFIPLVTR